MKILGSGFESRRDFRLPTAAIVSWSVVVAQMGCRPASTPVVQQPSALETALHCLENARTRVELSTRRNSPWEVIHAMMAFGNAVTVFDEESQQSLSLTDYVARGAPFFSETTFRVFGDHIEVRGSRYPGEFERHQDQFLAAFALAGLSRTTLITSDGRTFQVNDLVASSKREFDSDAELSWTLIAYARYCDLQDEWTNQYGQRCSILELVRRELELEHLSPACGGSHRLFALSYASRHLDIGRVDVSLARRLNAYLNTEIRRFRGLQADDGSFPASLVALSSEVKSSDRRWKLHSSGHTMEWIVTFLPSDELECEWVKQGIAFLCSEVLAQSTEIKDRGSYWYHAVHGIRIYNNRLAGDDY